MENQDKKEAIKERKEAVEDAATALISEEVAMQEKQIAMETADQYNETLVQIEEEVNSMKQMNVRYPQNLQRLNTINEKIELSREHVKTIEARPIRRPEEQ